MLKFQRIKLHLSRSYQFCQQIKLAPFEQLQFSKPELWNTYQIIPQTNMEDYQLPQSVVASRLKYLNSRNQFFQQLQEFSLNKTNPSYYLKALYEIQQLEEFSNLNDQIDVNPDSLLALGFESHNIYSQTKIAVIIFQIENQPISFVLGFIESIIAHMQNLSSSFQEIPFMNILKNLNNILLQCQKRNTLINDKLIQLFQLLSQILYQNDYLNQCQPMNIANILGYANEIIITYHLELQQQIYQNYKESAQTFFNKYSEIGNSIQQFNIIDHKNMIYTMFFSNLVPESISSSIINGFAEQGIEFGDTNDLIELMGLMLVHNIKCTELLLRKLQEGKKQKLEVLQLFIIIKSYELAQRPLNEYSMILFQDLMTIVNMQDDFKDINQYLMFIRVLRSIFASAFSSSGKAIEKRNEKIIQYLDKQLNQFQSVSFNHLLFIANSINQHLKIPSFLIEQLYLQLDNMELTDQTVSLYTEFLDIAYEYFQPKYSYLQKTDAKISMNSFPTNSYKEVVTKFTNKLLNDSHLVYSSQVYLSVLKILTLKFFELPIPTVTQFIQTLITSINEIKHDIPLLAKAASVQMVTLDSNFINLLLDTPLKNEELIEIVYHMISSNDYQLPTPIIDQTKYLPLLGKIKDAIIEQININQQYSIQQKEVDGFIYSFPEYNSISTFKSHQYILPIIYILQIQNIPQNIFLHLQQQLNRVIKSFCGDILVLNLILYQHFNLHDYEAFVKAASSLTSTMLFNKDSEIFMINNMLIIEQNILALVRAYLYQIKESDFIANESVKIIGFFASLVFQQLSEEEIGLLCKMLGSNQQMYYPKLLLHLKQTNLSFKHKSKNIAQQNILKLASIIPVFNSHIQQQINQWIAKQEKISLNSEFLSACIRQNIQFNNLEESFTELSNEKKIEMIPFILEYLLNIGFDNEMPIEQIIEFSKEHINQLCIRDRLIFLILYCLQKINQCYTINYNSQKQIFQIHKNGIPFVFNDDEESLLQEIYNQNEEILNEAKFNNQQIKFYSSFVVEYDENQRTNWKILNTNIQKSYSKSDLKMLNFNQQIEKKLDNQYSQLKNFLIQNVDNRKIYNLQYYLTQLDFIDLLKLQQKIQEDNEQQQQQQQQQQSTVLSQIQQFNEDKLQEFKNNEQYINFLLSLTLAIPVSEPQYDFTYQSNFIQDIISLINLCITDENIKKKFYFQYITSDDIVQNGTTIRLKPLKLLESLRIMQHGQLYLINFDEWIRIYSTKKKHQEFLKSILLE